jgi:hypothetical protein
MNVKSVMIIDYVMGVRRLVLRMDMMLIML